MHITSINILCNEKQCKLRNLEILEVCISYGYLISKDGFLLHVIHNNANMISSMVQGLKFSTDP